MKILLVIVLICFLIGRITVGVDLRYVGGELTISAKLCGFLKKIYPREKKPAEEKPKEEKKPEPKEEKPKKEKKKKPKKKKEGLGLMISGDELIELLQKILKGLGKFSKGINVDHFLLHLVVAGKDPYNTAMIFAYLNALLSSLAPLCAQRFRCKDPDVWTDIDFNSGKWLTDIEIAVVLRVGAVFAMLGSILFGVLGILIRNKWEWFRLKHFDKEEYEFRVENPGIVTRLIRSLLNKEDGQNQSGEEKPEETGENKQTEVISNQQDNSEDKQEITEQERTASNG